MSFARHNSGRRGEGIALSYLKEQGYRILIRNYRTRQGEIDIIGTDKDFISFIEVRSINSTSPGLPEYTIDKRKQHQIAKVALSYIKKEHLWDKNCRFDVVCIEDVDSASPNIRLIKNAFELDAWYRY